MNPLLRKQLNLDGAWTLAYSEQSLAFTTIAEIEASGVKTIEAVVPGNVELDFQAAGLIDKLFYGMNIAGLRHLEKTRFWYYRRFEISEAEVSRHSGCDPILRFEGVDCGAEYYLNGLRFGSSDNALVEHEFAVGGALSKGTNELVILLRSTVEDANRFPYPPGVAPHAACNFEGLYLRKPPHCFGWDIMPRAASVGLWRSVCLLWLPRERIEWVDLQTLVAHEKESKLALAIRVQGDDFIGDVYELAVEGVCGDSRFESRHHLLFGAQRFYPVVPNALLWWPKNRGEPNLYQVTVRLLKNGVEIDRAVFQHGIRTVELERTETTDAAGAGEFCFRVNGEKIFILGTNHVPADAYHSRDAARLPAILQLLGESGCNMVRCWGGNVYENDLFYDWCDANGVLVWQDFALACASYPQDDLFAARLTEEARKVVRRLRGHACLAVWAGDNECDLVPRWLGLDGLDPNRNRLTREVLPRLLREEDPARPYLPSSPYVNQKAFSAGQSSWPENHLWGPRDYYKSRYYTGSNCHFASEMGYHGCPSPESVRHFISPEKLWPPQDNEEWQLHSTSPIPGAGIHDGRIQLMINQVRETFGEVPDNLDDFACASQVVQAEAMKFFIELFRTQKWRRTGIVWWNLCDGWPQFSDAVVDYYGEKKLAFEAIRRAQRPLLLALCEPENWVQQLVLCNDTRDDLQTSFRMTDIETGETVIEGTAVAAADTVTPLGTIPFSAGCKRFYLLEWKSELGAGMSHYLAGYPAFDLKDYQGWHAAFEKKVADESCTVNPL